MTEIQTEDSPGRAPLAAILTLIVIVGAVAVATGFDLVKMAIILGIGFVALAVFLVLSIIYLQNHVREL